MNKEISEVRRVYTNTDIQRKISDVLRNFNENELDEFCNKEYSKELFNLSFSLLVKYHKKDSIDSKNELIKRNGLNRWTYKYNIESKITFMLSQHNGINVMMNLFKDGLIKTIN
ncbi:hypothetical protein [Polaribacter sp. 20A6]|uniref:hypothetical protein n=1 Tax=Polaribacter sp. 20A6 TaxID=2687289 RepID=UPI0013FD9FF3|nr:hypothetical protein [Polaribacter sp. 20A6]